MPKALSISWSEGVSEAEAQVLLKTVEQTLNWLYFRHPSAFYDPPILVRVYGNWIIPAIGEDYPYGGIKWYVEASYDQGLQRVIAPVYLELVRREPWQRMDPHLDLVLLGEDLTEFPAPLARLYAGHYALGASFPGTAAVMSLWRLRQIADEELRRLALARLVRHHLGHVLAIPPFERREEVARRGLEMHCTRRCVMRHAETVEHLMALTLEEAEMGWPFCALCTQGLHSAIIRYDQEWS
ncbi:MAG: hypothetical protein H5T66_00260 [Chloroflexi bacterium]|nr:hypothetical protein [Chloroflexota bacterium]